MGMEGQYFSDWHDRECNCLKERYEKEFREGFTESTYEEWTQQEFETGCEIEAMGFCD